MRPPEVFWRPASPLSVRPAGRRIATFPSTRRSNSSFPTRSSTRG